ncbi:unnamed protein product [Euphydryas editha]|uniref:THAP9-like helix-turn-helix domain-containing protein n=1 Tax=Euphydryas editha TaxID=104508 RepID=A0AAU9THS0_EUPED|nr:unnamed protein product [Euphydryas editha]
MFVVVEYIDEETLDNEYEDEDYLMDSDEYNDAENYQRELMNKKSLTNVSNHVSNKTKEEDSLELLKLFTEVQKMQRQAVSLKEKLKSRMKIYKRQTRFLSRVKEIIEMKKNILNQRRKKKSRILLSLQDKIREDTNGLVLAMPTRHTDDLKNFALSIYKYSPQAYIYIRNTLRTLLPSTEVLESWVSSGYEPKNALSNSNLIKVVSELTDAELSCKVSLR